MARSSHQSNSIGTLFPLFFLFRPRPGLRIGFRRVFVLFPPLVEQVFTRVFFFLVYRVLPGFARWHQHSLPSTSEIGNLHTLITVFCCHSERERERESTISVAPSTFSTSGGARSDSVPNSLNAGKKTIAGLIGRPFRRIDDRPFGREKKISKPICISG